MVRRHLTGHRLWWFLTFFFLFFLAGKPFFKVKSYAEAQIIKQKNRSCLLVEGRGVLRVLPAEPPTFMPSPMAPKVFTSDLVQLPDGEPVPRIR